MLEIQEYVDAVVKVACDKGYAIEVSARNGETQIDFGNKKLHAEQLRNLYPAILLEGADVRKFIEKVAPGRPCSHKPMREIIEIIKETTTGEE